MFSTCSFFHILLPTHLHSHIHVFFPYFLHWEFFPLSTVLEMLHPILFWQFLLNFNSQVWLQGLFFVLGLGLILFVCLRSFSYCLFHSFSLQLISDISHTLYSLVCVPGLCFFPHCFPSLLSSAAGPGVSRQPTLLLLPGPLFDLCPFQFNEEIVKLREHPEIILLNTLFNTFLFSCYTEVSSEWVLKRENKTWGLVEFTMKPDSIAIEATDGHHFLIVNISY